MKRTFAAAIFALFAVTAPTAPARAVMVDPPFAWYQTDTLNLAYPNNTTLTGDLYIEDGAPSVGDYEFAGDESLRVNGTLLTGITGGTGFVYAYNPSTQDVDSITFFVPPPGAPDAPTPYGQTPLYLSVPNIFLNGVPAHGGTIRTQFCSVAGNGTSCSNLSTVPLPAALPMFGAAVAGLGGAGWWKKRAKVSRTRKA
jgi:hypothetical protein